MVAPSLNTSKSIICEQISKGQFGVDGDTGMKHIIISRLRTGVDKTKLISEL